MKAFFGLALAVVLSLFLSPLFLGQAWAQNAVSPPPQATNPIAQAAVQQGAFNCAKRINQVSNFLGYSAKAGAVLMISPTQPDQQVLPLAMEVPTLNNGAGYVAATFAPNQANGCGVAYDAVVFWHQACAIVAKTQFQGLKPGGFLGKKIMLLDGGMATKVFLMPAENGCISIKKEMLL